MARKFPEPLCEGGFPWYQVEEILGEDAMKAFSKWMAGQTMMLCEGRSYNHETKEYEPSCGGMSHGGVVYAWDFKRYLGIVPGKDIFD